MHRDPSTVSTSVPEFGHDHAAICHWLVGYEFPWELNRALELAVLKTFCVPRIAQLLRQTGEFVQRPQKRYDDTGLIIGNIMKWGYDSPQGRAAIATLNRIHQRFAIPNEDFLYVLSVLIYEPVRWNERFGWRPFTTAEKQALFEFWHAVGLRMAIADIPTTYEAFQQFSQAYEDRYFCYSPHNQAIGNAVVQLMQSWLPAIVSPIVPTIVHALVDPPTRQALGWPQPAVGTTWAIRQLFQVRRWGLRWFPRRRRSHFFVDTSNASYPQGYHLDTLGPEDVSPPPSRCPFLRMQSFFKSGS